MIMETFYTFLFLLGVPSSFEINAMVKDCASIEVTLFDVQKDTMYEYKLYDSDHKSLFSVTSNKTTELIPTNFLYDHTGEYIIVVVPAMNPAGSGQPVNYTLDLSAINGGLFLFIMCGVDMQ